MQNLLLIQPFILAMLRYLLKFLLRVSNSIKLFHIRNLELWKQCNGSFGAYALHVIETIILPLGLTKGKLHLLHFLSHGYGFCREFLKLLAPFIINFVPFIPIFHFFSIKVLYIWVCLLQFGFVQLNEGTPIFLRVSLCSSIALNIFYAISSLIGAAIVA